jgi:hypothetical protein
LLRCHAQNQSQLAELVIIKCLLGLGGIFQIEGPRNVDFKRPAIDQFIQLGERLRIGFPRCSS